MSIEIELTRITLPADVTRVLHSIVQRPLSINYPLKNYSYGLLFKETQNAVPGSIK
jgi:hypothetical protein